MDREFKIPNAVVVGRIKELAVSVEGGQTHLVLKFLEPLDSATVCELEYAAHLAAHRIEILAGGGLLSDRVAERNADSHPLIGGLIGESELIRQVRQEIEIAASLDLSVLITGEPGTGKELVARGIHKASRRAGKPFVGVNCAAINPNLIESELFGHEKGAFTGALARKPGRFERANGGTLFLDEIGDLPQQSQATLLRVLQEREFERVGGTQAVRIDIRLIAATNRDLLREVDEGRFRRDLYDRLCGYPIRTPALRERPTDIPILIRHYLPSAKFEEEALESLCRYDWPGNVRQLISTVERLAAKAGGRIITTDHVRREVDLGRKSTPGHGDQSLIRNFATVGVHQVNINPTNLRKTPILLPKSLDEQEKIIAVFSRVDRVIELIKVLIAKQQRLKTGLMQKLLTKGIDEQGNRRSEATHEFKDSPLGEIPATWKVKKVGELFDMKLGKMLNKQAKQGNAQFPYLANCNVQWEEVDLSDLETMHFSEEEREKLSLQSGDLLICEGGEVGRTAIWKGEMADCYFQKAIHRLRPKDGRILPEYMLAFMRVAEQRGLFTNLTSQTSIAHLTQEKLALLPVPLPPPQEQNRINDILKIQGRQIGIEKSRLSKLTKLKKGLMRDLLTGKIRVNTLLEAQSRTDG
jgi:DNA-binding NtrC family response regulator